MNDIDNILIKLQNSKFRNSFHLNNKMKEYVKERGLEVVREHAFHFINERLKPKYIENDGKQTPMRQVHPVFIAQHACACCCRSCLYQWHHINKDKELTDKEVKYIVDLLMRWIEKEFTL